MFDIGEKVKIDTYHKEVEIFAHIVKKEIRKYGLVYIVEFRNGEKGAFFESELLKIQ